MNSSIQMRFLYIYMTGIYWLFLCSEECTKYGDFEQSVLCWHPWAYSSYVKALGYYYTVFASLWGLMWSKILRAEWVKLVSSLSAGSSSEQREEGKKIIKFQTRSGVSETGCWWGGARQWHWPIGDNLLFNKQAYQNTFNKKYSCKDFNMSNEIIFWCVSK